MSSIDYKHTWTFNEESLILRVYAWAWDADPKQADFCRLFWGYVFLWLALIVRAVAFVVSPIARAIERRLPARKPKPLPTLRPVTPPLERAPSRGERALSRIGEIFARRGVRVLLVGLAAVLGIAVAALLVVLIVNHFVAFLLLLAQLVGTVVVVALAVGAGLFLDRTGTLKRIGSGFKRFGRFMLAGARAVKANTCPKVEVIPTQVEHEREAA